MERGYDNDGTSNCAVRAAGEAGTRKSASQQKRNNIANMGGTKATNHIVGISQVTGILRPINTKTVILHLTAIYMEHLRL